MHTSPAGLSAQHVKRKPDITQMTHIIILEVGRDGFGVKNAEYFAYSLNNQTDNGSKFKILLQSLVLSKLTISWII